MVRDDFWLSVTRFMDQLEVRLEEGANSAAVDLFSLRHARRVLAAFGRAFGALPESHEEALDDEQREFLKQAVEGLSEGGTVIPVRLALLAEMVKTRSLYYYQRQPGQASRISGRPVNATRVNL